MRYAIERACQMRFASPAREHHVQLRLAPWDDESQALLGVEVAVSPAATVICSRDGFGNLAHHFAVLGAHQELSFRVRAQVETRFDNPFDFTPVSPERERAWISDCLHQAPRLWDLVLHRGPLTPTPPGRIADQEVPTLRPDMTILRQVSDLSAWIRSVIAYAPDLREPASGLPSLLDAGRGSATDLTHLLIAIVRQWSIPARFVSGYLDAAYFDPDDEDLPEAAPRPQTLHQWAEVLIPGAGWRGFDPSLGLLADATYVRVAVGRDARDVEPLRQTWRYAGSGPLIEETLTVVATDAET